MSSEAITSAFNDGYIAEAYEAYRRDPQSVDESWRQFFRFAEQLGGGEAAPSEASLRAAAGAAALIAAIRAFGHNDVAMDPLGSPPPGAPELNPEFHHVSEAELATVPGAALGLPDATAAAAVARLRTLYCSTMGFEFEHLQTATERQWLRKAVESGTYHQPLTADEQKNILGRLTDVDALERFLGRAYQGYKRFSVEGSDALVVMLDEVIALAALNGASDVAIAMAHRGRINVLAHTMGMPYGKIFEEFHGKQISAETANASGDVKYHLGYDGSREIGGRRIALTLVPNPSHLEFVNPVLQGVTRARQWNASGARDENLVIPVCVHGDAAFSGEGIVAETLNLSLLTGFRTGGTVHIIVNNQVGFTTDPQDARSTQYSSDLARGFDIPIIHVNGDDPASCVQAVRMVAAYRATFGKDALIDLVSYRRHGHNETDEPAFTQPILYQKVRAHKTPRQVWGDHLIAAGLLTADDVEAMDQRVMTTLEEIQSRVGTETTPPPTVEHDAPAVAVETAVSADALQELNEALLRWPDGFKPNSRVARTLLRRRDAMGEAGGIDWGQAEALALGSILRDGTSVRITGQDVERGTFSHRQDVLHDAETGAIHVPLRGVTDKARFEIFNSPLSEAAVLGFEYGYSVAASDTLVLWEAQYGDFANVAQPIVDQFVSSGRAKWGQASGLTMLLPHGYEGGGPEHSSARLERYLQLCGEGNMCVAYPSTPAQYFHILRRQAKMVDRCPLILMQPKSLLRLPAAASKLHDLATGTFKVAIDDAAAAQQRERVKRVVFCTGKIYYDLLEKRGDDPAPEVALVRVEELYPWPHDEIARIVDSYPAIDDVVWAQEEPKNMGAWTYISPRLRVSTGNAISVRYIGRSERASPAEGYSEPHKIEQERIVNEVFALPQAAHGGRARTIIR